MRSIGNAYANGRDDDRVIQEVNQTIKNNAQAALYGCGVAKLMKGDAAASNADFEMAKDIKPSIVDEFAKVGVSAQARSGFRR